MIQNDNEAVQSTELRSPQTNEPKVIRMENLSQNPVTGLSAKLSEVDYHAVFP